MNDLWHIIIVKISSVVVAVLIFVGLAQPAIPSQTTIIDIQPLNQMSSTSTSEVLDITPTAPKIVNKISALTFVPIQLPAMTIATTIPAAEPIPTTLAITSILETTPQVTASEPIPQPMYAPIYIIQQPTLVPTPVSMIEESIIQPINMQSITIISPIPSKGLGREYLSRPEIKDEFNYLELGLIVRDAEGKPVKNLKVIVTSDRDNTQDKTMSNTGNVTPIYENGVKIITPYYPFSYHITKPGKHVITFTCDGVMTSIDFIAKPDNRP